MPGRAKCKSCGAPILWATSSATGRPVPLDAEVRDDGNIRLVPEGRRQYAVVGGPGSGYYVSHFATCPHSRQHRRPAPAVPSIQSPNTAAGARAPSQLTLDDLESEG